MITFTSGDGSKYWLFFHGWEGFEDKAREWLKKLPQDRRGDLVALELCFQRTPNANGEPLESKYDVTGDKLVAGMIVMDCFEDNGGERDWWYSFRMQRITWPKPSPPASSSTAKKS